MTSYEDRKLICGCQQMNNDVGRNKNESIPELAQTLGLMIMFVILIVTVFHFQSFIMHFKYVQPILCQLILNKSVLKTKR